MKVTIMTDASVCPTGAAGYGFWIVSARGGTPGGGSFKSNIKDGYEGEFKAAVNALSYGVNNSLIQANDAVLVQLDNKGVVDILKGKAKPREDLEVAHSMLKKILNAHKLKLRARHVKGHTKVNDQRSKANRMCDMRARLAMKEARQRANVNSQSTEST